MSVSEYLIDETYLDRILSWRNGIEQGALWRPSISFQPKKKEFRKYYYSLQRAKNEPFRPWI